MLTLEFWDDDQRAEPTKATWNIAVADVAGICRGGQRGSDVSENETEVVQISGSSGGSGEQRGR
ncbi:MAG UNVERIFIED_CONTAM: hypothetical protein LVR18_49775 [Planctomycetaceae bacterium]